MVEAQANWRLKELQRQMEWKNCSLRRGLSDVNFWSQIMELWRQRLDDYPQLQDWEDPKGHWLRAKIYMLEAESFVKKTEYEIYELQMQMNTEEMNNSIKEVQTQTSEIKSAVRNFLTPISQDESEVAVIGDREIEESPTPNSGEKFKAGVTGDLEELSVKGVSLQLPEQETASNSTKKLKSMDSFYSSFPLVSDKAFVINAYPMNLVEFLDEECVDFENMTGGSGLIQWLGTNDDSLPVYESIACYDPGIFKNRSSEPYKKWFKDHGVSEKSCECDGGINCKEGKIVNVLLPENSSLEIVGFPSVWIFEDMLKKIGQNNCEVTELEVGFGADKFLKLLKCYEMSRVDEGLKWIDSAMIFDPGICVGILRSFGVHSTPKRMGVGESSGKIIVGRTRNKTKVTEFCLWNEWSSEIKSLDAFSSEWQSIEQNKMVEIFMVLCSFDRGKMNDDGSKRFGMNSAETRNSVKTWLDRSMFFLLENLGFLVIIEPFQVQHKEVMNCGNLRMLQWYTTLKSDDENDVCIVAVQFSVYAADHNSKNASWHKRRSLVCMRFCRPWDKYASSFKGGTKIVDMMIYNKKQVAEEQFTGTTVDPNYSVAGLFFFPSNFSLRSSCYLRRREIYEINGCVLGILGSVEFLENVFELGTCNLLIPGAVCLFSSKGFWGCVSRDGTDGARSMTILIFVLHSSVMHDNDYSKGSSSGGDQGKKGLTLEFLEDDESMVRRKISSGGDHSSTSMFSTGRSWMNQATQSEEIFGISKKKQVQLHDKYEIAAERPELHLSCVHRFIPFHLHWSWQRHFCKEVLELLVSRFHRATAVKEETAKYALRIFVGMVKAQTSVAQFSLFSGDNRFRITFIFLSSTVTEGDSKSRLFCELFELLVFKNTVSGATTQPLTIKQGTGFEAGFLDNWDNILGILDRSVDCLILPIYRTELLEILDNEKDSSEVLGEEIMVRIKKCCGTAQDSENTVVQRSENATKQEQILKWSCWFGIMFRTDAEANCWTYMVVKNNMLQGSNNTKDDHSLLVVGMVESLTCVESAYLDLSLMSSRRVFSPCQLQKGFMSDDEKGLQMIRPFKFLIFLSCVMCVNWWLARRQKDDYRSTKSCKINLSSLQLEDKLKIRRRDCQECWLRAVNAQVSRGKMVILPKVKTVKQAGSILQLLEITEESCRILLL